MTNTIDNQLLSHQVSAETIEAVLQKITNRIESFGDKPYVTVKRQLELLKELSEFDFGRFLLQNQGVNGYWTHYMLTHPWFGRKSGKNNRGESFSPLEHFLLDRAPTMLATQQRFEIFLKQNQQQVKNHAKLACVPSGMLGELLYLDFSDINQIELVGIDYDVETLQDAESLAHKKQLSHFLKLIEKDAWKMNFSNEFDLLSSNGLNFYEPDNNRVTDLYRCFHQALKPNGKLVTSFLTYPPTLTDSCEWTMSKINQEDLLLQKILFVDIIQVRWQQCYRSTEETKQQLTDAGFNAIEFIYDDAKMMPTVLAYKK